MVVNLSDLYAMNTSPSQVTVSLGISSKYSIEDRRYYKVNKAAKMQNKYMGGDIILLMPDWLSCFDSWFQEKIKLFIEMVLN